MILCFAVFFVFIGILLGGYLAGHKYCLKLEKCREISDKHLHILRMYDVWMMAKEEKRTIEEYLIERNIKNAAIYGMSYLGVRLFQELKNTSVDILFALDVNPRIRMAGLDIYHPDEIKTKQVDGVIVTAIFCFDEIKVLLEAKGFNNIIALDEILYDLI